MDSMNDTLKHIRKVQQILSQFAFLIFNRAINHDASKLETPEKPVFDEVGSRLKELVYGTPEYYAGLKALTPALEHHYRHNSHHPEHYKNGVDGMNLLDLVEMLCDWKAASERYENGDVRQSIRHNAKRFNISEQLLSIMLNTCDVMDW